MVKSDKNSKLHNAIYDNDFELVKNIILKNPNSINNRKHWLKEPIIHIACEQGNFDIVRFIINSGANIHVKGHMNSSSLQYAVNGGNVEIVNLLISLGLDVNSVRENNGDETPLFFAINEECVDALIKNGASINKRNWSYRVALHFASQFGYNSAISGLIKNGADVNVEDKEGITPLHLAKNNHIAKFLLNLGAKNIFLD